MTVALRLGDKDESPTLEELADALREPARPLFIGRKPCLPSAPLFADFIEAETTLDALLKHPLERDGAERDDVRLLWPAGEGVARGCAKPRLHAHRRA